MKENKTKLIQLVLVEFILCMDEEGAGWLKLEYGFSVGRNQHKSDHKIREIS